MRVVVMSSFRKDCGIGMYTFQFLHQLLRHKDIERVYLFTHTDSDITLLSPKLEIYRIINEKYPFYTLKLSYLLKKIKADVIDVEWDHSLFSPPWLLGSYVFPLLSNFKDKIFLSLHSLYHSEDVERYLNTITGNKVVGKLGSKYYSSTKRFLLKNFAVGRVFTLYEYEQVKRMKRNFVLIPQGIEEIRRAKRKKKDKITLTIFGFIRKSKDYKLAIESLSLLPKNFRLIIAGQPKEIDLLRKIRLWAKKYGVEERVTMIPRLLSSKEKEFIMKKTDILLLPYLLTSNSGVLLDGIKYCKPVVSTVLQQDLASLGIGIYTPRENDSFAEAILTVDNRYKELQENIRRVQPKFLWRNILPQILDSYRKLTEI